MLLGCGDLPYSYLEYLLTVMDMPLYYIPGNHDPHYTPHSALTHVEGGTNLDMRVAFEKGVLLAGLGGSVRYRPDGVNQYSQAQAYIRALRLLPAIWFNCLRYGRGLDILITHSPPFAIHDDDTPAHHGLKALNMLIRTTCPRYHFHGHTHFYRRNLTDSVTRIGNTTVMNIFPYKLIEIMDAR